MWGEFTLAIRKWFVFSDQRRCVPVHTQERLDACRLAQGCGLCLLIRASIQAHKAKAGEVVKMLHRIVLPHYGCGQTGEPKEECRPWLSRWCWPGCPMAQKCWRTVCSTLRVKCGSLSPTNGQSGYMMARYLMAVTDLPAWVPLL